MKIIALLASLSCMVAGCATNPAPQVAAAPPADGKQQGAPWLGMKIEDVGTLDRMLIIGSFLRKDQPLLAAPCLSGAWAAAGPVLPAVVAPRESPGETP